MALVKVLKVGSTGLPTQHDSSADEIAMLTGQFGNIKMSGNIISSEDTNGNVNIVPNGTGSVQFYSAYTFPSSDGTSGQILETNGSGALSFQTPSVGQVKNEYTADEALAAVDALYISAADNLSKADASAESTSRVVGFNCSGAVSDTDPVQLASEGLLGGFTGLTPGARYFLSETAGLITSTPPSTDEAAIVQVGYAKSATELQIHIEYIAELETD